MFPGMNPREMQKAMKRLGIQQEEIEAHTVIIKTEGMDLIFHNPQVSKVNMMGQNTYQIVGEPEEVDNSKTEISDEDIGTVAEQANVSKEEALEALQETNGNIAEAILKLQNR